MSDAPAPIKTQNEGSSPHLFPVDANTQHGSSTGPQRYIFTQADMEHFRHSSARKELLSFVTAMGRGLTNDNASRSGDCPGNYDPKQPLGHLTPALASLHGSLSYMADKWMSADHPDGIPPDTKAKARFGNPAFRTWHARLVTRSYGIVTTCLECHLKYSSGSESDQLGILKDCFKRGYDAASTDEYSAQMTNANEEDTIEELRAYLHDSFGHPIRIDYGTGHESSFIVFLLAFCKIGCFVWNSGMNNGTNDSVEKRSKPAPSPLAISRASVSLLHAYLNVTRGLQKDYMLEPAGSHGVWGLDDYHCIPFFVGACQMVAREQWQQQKLKEYKQSGEKADTTRSVGKQESDGDVAPMNPYLPANALPDPKSTPSPVDSHNDNMEYWEPSIIHNRQVLETHRSTYLYLGCVHFIREIKPNVPFFESSSMLNDISSMGNWTKVSSGLLRLYEGEVLDKLPVVQHFVFGKIFNASWTPSKKGPLEAPKWTFINGPMGDECIAPWAVNDVSQGEGGINRRDNSGSSGCYPGGMPPTRAPWAK